MGLFVFPQQILDQLKLISKTQLAQDILVNVGPSVLLLYVFIDKTEPYFINNSNILILTLSFIGGLSSSFFLSPQSLIWFILFLLLSYLFTAFTVFYYLIIALHSYYARNIRLPRRKISSYVGKWAIVTGASSAIGSAFCTTLASYGMNILLIGRSKEKLQNLAHHIHEQTNGRVKTRILVHDFIEDNMTTTAQFQNLLKSKLEKYSHHNGIGMLIHCVNFRNDTPTLIHEMDWTEVQRLLETNIFSTVQLIQTLLPFFIQQKCGAIVTVSSHACHHPAPLFSLYTASNAYRSAMMKSLFHECKYRYNVDCISVTPELMSSNIPRKISSTTMVKSQSADRVVNNTLRMLGYEDEAFPFRGHAQSTWIPKWIWVNPWDRFLEKMKNTRAEMLRKQYSDDH